MLVDVLMMIKKKVQLDLDIESLSQAREAVLRNTEEDNDGIKILSIEKVEDESYYT